MAAYIYNEQKDLMEKIDQLYRNIKKEPIERRSRERINKKLNEIEALWTDFEGNDDTIRKNDPNLTDNYFVDDMYKITQAKYNACVELLNEFLSKIDEKVSDKITKLKPDGVDQKTNENDLKLKSLTKRIQFRINRLEKFIMTSNESVNKFQTKSHFDETISKLQQMMDGIHLKLEDLIVLADENYEEEINEIVEKLDEVTETFDDTIQKLRKAADCNAPIRKNNPPKLPPISITKFNGDFRKWTAFKNLFFNVIHDNETLSNVEKLRYLQINLENEPSKLISHLQLTNENYESALKIVIDRYDNKRKIADMYIDILLELPATIPKSAASVKSLHDNMNECIEGLKSLNLKFNDSSNDSFLLTRIGIKKLDSESLKCFEENLQNSKETPSLKQLLNFLESRFLLLESINEKKSQKVVNSNFISKSKKICILCSGEHFLHHCKSFEGLAINERNKIVRKYMLCKNCISHKSNKKCTSKFSCSICGMKHHTLLHYDDKNHSVSKEKVASPADSTKNIITQKSISEISSNHISNRTAVLLSTALVYIKSVSGTFEPFRALIDPGSQASLITEESADLLNLPRFKSNIGISGLGANKQKMAKHKIEIEIRPHFSKKVELQIHAYILPKLTGNIPSEPIIQNKSHFNDFILADPNYDTPGAIDLILGADAFSNIILKGIRIGNPTAMKTKLGWLLNGPTQEIVSTNTILSNVSTSEVNESITKFWNIEEVKPENQDDSDENEIIQKSNISRDLNGRYVVNLPFKNSIADLGLSRNQALARFFQVERLLEKDVKKRNQYHSFIREYIQLGHMEKIENILHNDGYYLPHHGVWKNDSITTKLRVVFDASAVTTNGKSLNDELMIGPTIQELLTTILTRWRTHRYVFTADIEKMYRQIKVAEKDQKYQKILWRFSKKDPVQEFKLTTVTYGTASAPYQAIRTLHQLACDEKNEENSDVIETIKRDFYVDDLMSGASTREEAMFIIQNINSIMEKGGFCLRKWMSNDEYVLQNVASENKLDALFELNKDSSIKTLGVWWNPISDKFTFKINIDTVQKRTKRVFLSNMSKLFDPMGWLAPIIITAKLTIQELWAGGFDWDDELPGEFQKKWITLERELPILETLEIPRYMHLTKESILEIHGFCDASEKAYAAVIYAKVTNEEGTFVTLLGAKTRVAPLKKEQTIPRLELCGAVLLVKYCNEVMKAFQIKDETPIYYWTDSTITLAWIKGQSQKWKSFVAHRVAEINQRSSKNQWFHVNTKENPADIASRGISPSQILQSDLWWQGPSWLKEYVKRENDDSVLTTTEELRTPEKYNKLCTLYAEIDANTIINRYSSIGRLIRVVAYMRRFKTRATGRI